MGKFLNPFTDVGFKKLFGQEVNKELLIEFLNDLFYLLKHMETLERMPFEARKAVFKKLLEVANVENMTPEER